jgi:hypothetical protein
VLVRGVYVLRRDQILLIEVEDHPELTGRYLVQDDGPRTLPAAGSISVGKEPDFKRVLAAAVPARHRRYTAVMVTEVPSRW